MNEQDCKKLAELLFPDVDKTPDYYEEKYPYRKLPNKAEVTILGPSPTGFIHLGNLYSALADERIAHKNGGVFYLRIEDTDAKRTVEGAVDLVINSLRYFDIEFDEGAGFPDSDPVNAYGPYYQTQRVDIYHTFAKELVLKGLAYPCFCTEEELEAVRLQQEADKVLTGYYGKYAVCRDLSLETIEENLKAGKPYVLRLRSQGSPENEITFTDSGIADFMQQAEEAGVNQCMCLSTCNRCEVFYLYEDETFVQVMSDLFNDYFGLTDTKLAGVKCGEEALVYLFCIAAGLESMVLGEDQILGQLKDAADLSRTLGHSGKELNYIVRAVSYTHLTLPTNSRV